METLEQIRNRHKREVGETKDRAYREERALRKRQKGELRAALDALAMMRMTQTEACKLFGTKISTLNQLIRRERIFWPVKAQGRRPQ